MKARLTLALVKAAKAGSERYLIWDEDVRGFGIRINCDSSKTYVLKYRFHGKQRWHTIGVHGSPFTPEMARNEALKVLFQARSGIDPAEAKRKHLSSKLTVSDLCDRYIHAVEAGQVLTKSNEPKKASTLGTDRGRIERHIKPLLGKKFVCDVTSDDVEAFLHRVAAGDTAGDVKTGKRGLARVRGGRGTASRTVGLLGGIFTYAAKKKLVGENPVRGVKRFKDRNNERYLTGEEIGQLGVTLIESELAWSTFAAQRKLWFETGQGGAVPKAPKEAENPSAIAAIRLLLLTGARKSEVVFLKWEHVDPTHGYLRLQDSKTGPKSIPVGQPALDLLASLPRFKENPYVFVGEKQARPFIGLPKVWERVRDRAGLAGVRLHDLRHTFASVGASSGNSLLVLGALLGHRDTRTTQKYAHLAGDPMRAAARQLQDLISMKLGALVDVPDSLPTDPPIGREPLP